MNEPQEGDLRIWWVPQVPGKPFHVDVSNIREALVLLDVLAKYDLFQYEHRIKPDYSNAGGLEVFEDGEWSEWESPDGLAADDMLPPMPARDYLAHVEVNERNLLRRGFNEGFAHAEEQDSGFAGASGWTKINPYEVK